MSLMRAFLAMMSGLALAQAAVKLPSLLGDHMVLQRQAPVRVWGRANPSEAVAIRFRGQTVRAAADARGRWEAWLQPMESGGPFRMTIAGENTIALSDVMVGEVWVASGQSNMVWPVGRAQDAEKEIAAAGRPKIRLFKVALKVSAQPLEEVEGNWQAAGPETVKDFSAVSYFFARHLDERLGVPVGVIQSAWGGTPAEAWTSRPALSSDAALRAVLEEADKRTPSGPQNAPAALYNAMVAPLTPCTIRGVIWYQGESNAGAAQGYEYRHLFESLIRDWRRAWAQGNFPFLFVQLANFIKGGPDGHWSLVEEAQLQTLELCGTGMAVAIDIGDPNRIHPRNKQEVGRRLGLAARALVYGEKLVYSGPVFRQFTREGSRLRLWFDHVGGGLNAKGGALKGFYLAGADRVFVPAQARIEGATIVVSSGGVPEPAAVRYAWANNPDCNLYNAEGLPASPFRSDDWRDARMPE